MCCRIDLQNVQDCKVLPKKAVAKQHKLIVCKTEVQIKGRQRPERFKRTRCWKLNEVEHGEVRESNERRAVTGGMVLGGDEYENEGRGKRGTGG